MNFSNIFENCRTSFHNFDDNKQILWGFVLLWDRPKESTSRKIEN
jgi:hypothetical protein